MNYIINPSFMTSMFAIPAEIVDNHLKLASGIQLKVLLIALKNGISDDSVNIAVKTLGMSQTDVEECFEFWEQRNVFVNKEKEEKLQQKKNTAAKSVLIASKPTRAETVKRISESDELKFMFTEVQNKLGRLVTESEIATLVWIHDNQGLPVSVILMSVEYAISEGKTSFSYIEKVCIDWAQNEVDTVKKAEERLNTLYLSKTSWHIVESAFGISHRRPSANEKKYSYRWINEYGFSKDIIIVAYNKCIDSLSKMNFAYINKILEKWHKCGVKSVEDIDKVSENTKQTATKSNVKASYDLDKIKRKFNNFDEE